MVLDAVSNFVRGNTDAAIASGDTTVSVVDASIFPDPATDGEFNVVIWDVNNFPRPDQDGDVEIVRVTARDTGSNELTVVRGQETTSAAAHPDGSAIHLSPTAKMFSDIEGTFADFWDADAQQLIGDVNNTNTTTEALEARTIANNIKYARAFEGANADERLSDAISNATDGDIIQLESATYEENRTISKRLRIVGTHASAGSEILSATWTIEGVYTTLEYISFRGTVINLAAIASSILNSNTAPNGNDINVSADGIFFIGNRQGTVIFEEGTANGIVDACSRTTVTDNGTNTVGDIA